MTDTASTIRVGFVNTGRFGTPRTRAAFRHVADFTGKGWLGIVEVNEADNPATDHQLIRRQWLTRRLLFAKRGHEVLVVPRLARVHVRSVAGCAALEHQTPTRQWHVTRVKRRKVSLVLGHLPAGATGHNGEGSARRPDVRDSLAERYDAMMAVLEDVVATEHAAGYDVIVLADFNDPRGLTGPLVKHATEVTHHGPDGIYALPCRGREVTVVRGSTTALGLEAAHFIHDAVISFTDSKEQQ